MEVPPPSWGLSGNVWGVKIFGRNQDAVYNESTGYHDSADSVGLQSPWSDNNHLAAILMPEMPDGPISVEKALAVPPVARAVALYSTVIASLPLVAEGGKTPEWLTHSTGAITPGHRSADILQDLLFTNASVLYKDNLDGAGRPVTSATRMPREMWKLDDAGYVTDADGTRYNPERVIYVRGLMPVGFLEYGKSAVNHYHSLLSTILNRANNPVPLLDLHVTDQSEATKEELQEALDDWARARRSKNGAVAFTPSWIEAKTVGAAAGETMLTEARNAVRLDVANYLNINAAMLDGNNGTSDTYSNTLQNTNELLKLSMRQFLQPIEARFSQDDVTAPGVTVRFDTSGFDEPGDAAGNTGKAVERND